MEGIALWAEATTMKVADGWIATAYGVSAWGSDEDSAMIALDHTLEGDSL